VKVKVVRQPYFAVVGLVVLAIGLLTAPFLRSRQAPPTSQTVLLKAPESEILPIYALSPRSDQSLRNPEAVQRAVGFLLNLQPEGTYILSTADSPVVVPMDLTHAVIALTRVQQIDPARSAMIWLYERMILPSPSSVDLGAQADYAGSWYDGIQTNGAPVAGISRGRGEAVGMALIATYAVWSEDPGFLNVKIGDSRIADLLALSVDYLTQPSMEQPGAVFSHSPDYRVPFNEENARMVVGLHLASQMLQGSGDQVSAERAATAAAQGLTSLQQRTGMSQGMAYDYYAMSIWGLATPDQARSEMTWFKSTGLVDANGVHNWDWQLTQATTLPTWLRWWVQAQTVTPSPTFDYAIASVAAGNVQTALNLEQRWLPLQRPDGGFSDAYLFANPLGGLLGLHLGFSAPTSYAVARFILLERLLTDVLGGAPATGAL
jgi:hypothetical protein